MKAIGVHTYGGAQGNLACPVSPETLHAFVGIINNSKKSTLKKGIQYFVVNVPSPPEPLLGG